MKVGIIGSGIVGQVLAKAFKAEGYEVVLGTRNTSKVDVVKFNKETNIAIGTFQEAAKQANVIVLCTKGSAAEDAIKLSGVDNFSNKVVIDTTNPIADNEAPTNGVIHFFTSLEESLMERIQKLIPEAKVVKAFNSVGNVSMYRPNFPGGTPTMFICGNDDRAKTAVKDILILFGWETEDMGTIEAARAIEPLCILWCIPGFIRNQWTHAFKLLKT
ncbi:MAG TPA: NAD(P)-binding domain-containing protein [Chitinophagaceae bacterium]|nr:NAD(P)-binding domain-containing protein [Chitinophagaceae bacterium]